MNKKLLVLAIAAASVATTASAAQVYQDDSSTLTIGGRAEARLSMKDGETSDNSRVRLNVKGQTQITDNLYGVGFYEGEFKDADNGADDLDNRYIYAGFGGDFGEVTYGKNSGALGVLTDFTDIMAYHGNTAAYKLMVADRQGNMLGYKTAYDLGNAGNLDFKVSYAFADRQESLTDDGYDDDETSGVSTSLIYGIAGFKFGAGYAEQDSTHGISDQYILAASYEINNFYIGATFTDGDTFSGTINKEGNDSFDFMTTEKHDLTGYEVAMAYTVDKVVLSTTYNLLESDGKVAGKDVGDDGDLQNNLAFDATYFFNSNFRSYISYNLNLLDDDNVSDILAEDELVLGMRYDF